MPRKIDMITSLAEYTSAEITSSSEEWKKFLTTAGRMYKYPFEDQVLIYAQRPNATACASMEFWNEKMLCWVNKGAKGIALIDDSIGAGHRLKYVFDVKDVHESWYGGQKPVLWEMRDDYKDTVLMRLEEIYGRTDASKSFEDRIIEIADTIAADTYEDILPELMHEAEVFENPDEVDAEVFRDMLGASIAYMTLCRCGADMDNISDRLDLSNITAFNELGLVTVLGNATTDLAKPLLMEISRGVRQAQKNLQKNILQEMETGREEVYAHDNNIISTPEREEGATYGDGLHSDRGLSDTEPHGTEGAGGRPVQVGTDENELSEGEPQGSVRLDALKREAERALPSDSGTGRGDDGQPYEADDAVGERDRGAEDDRPDVLGNEDELDPEQGRGNRPLQPDQFPVTGAENFHQVTLFDTWKYRCSGSTFKSLRCFFYF